MGGKILTWIKNCWKQGKYRLGIKLSMFTEWKWLEFTEGMKLEENVGNPCDNERQQTPPGCRFLLPLWNSAPLFSSFFLPKRWDRTWTKQRERKGQQMGLHLLIDSQICEFLFHKQQQTPEFCILKVSGLGLGELGWISTNPQHEGYGQLRNNWDNCSFSCPRKEGKKSSR